MAPSRAGLALIRLAAARPTTASLTSPIAIPHHLFARRSLFSSSSLPQIRCCSRSRSRSSFRAAPLAPRLGSSPQNNHTPIAIGTAKANVPREAVHGCRAYSSSSSSSSPVEPPDYLDDKEKAIFETLREALGPTALEVRRAFCGRGKTPIWRQPPLLSPPVLSPFFLASLCSFSENHVM